MGADAAAGEPLLSDEAKAIADDVVEGPLSRQNRVCKDAHCCVLFILVWLVNAGVFYLALSKGDVYRLMYAEDYAKHTCGRENMTARPLGYYPRLAEDVLYALQDSSKCVADASTGSLSSCTVNLYALCVAECPAAGQIVCDNEREAELAALGDAAAAESQREKFAVKRDRCWRTPIAQVETFHRCVPDTGQVSVTTTYECDGVAIATGKKSTCTGLLSEATVTRVNTTAGADALMGTLISTTYTIKEWFGDCMTVGKEILFFGGLCALVVAGVYVVVQKYIAGPLIWLVIVLLWVLLSVTSAVFLLKGGTFFWQPLPTAAVTSTLATSTDLAAQYSNYLSAADGMEAKIWEAAGHTFFFLSIIYFFVICAITAKINLTVKLIQVTAQILQETPLIMLAPVIEWVALLCLFVFTFGGVGCIWTMDLTSADIASAVDQTTGLHCTSDQSIVTCIEAAIGLAGNITANQTITASPATDADESLFYPLLCYHVFACLWCWHFYSAFKTV